MINSFEDVASSLLSILERDMQKEIRALDNTAAAGGYLGTSGHLDRLQEILVKNFEERSKELEESLFSLLGDNISTLNELEIKNNIIKKLDDFIEYLCEIYKKRLIQDNGIAHGVCLMTDLDEAPNNNPKIGSVYIENRSGEIFYITSLTNNIEYEITRQDCLDAGVGEHHLDSLFNIASFKLQGDWRKANLSYDKNILRIISNKGHINFESSSNSVRLEKFKIVLSQKLTILIQNFNSKLNNVIKSLRKQKSKERIEKLTNWKRGIVSIGGLVMVVLAFFGFTSDKLHMKLLMYSKFLWHGLVKLMSSFM